LATKDNELHQLGVSVHHDAISGTAQQFVANDYAVRLSTALSKGNKIYQNEMNQLLQKKTGILIEGTLQ